MSLSHRPSPLPRRPLARVLAVLGAALLSLVGFGIARSGPAQEGGPSLAADGGIGTVTDREGVAQVRPAASARWSLAAKALRLKPGDWLRTGARGANAVAWKLGSARLILGPAGLAEMSAPGELRLLRGELEVQATEGAALRVIGPDGAAREVLGTRVLRSDERTLKELEVEPRWLSGYKGSASSEALGSLLATVDGRNVPLTMGYHKVTVDIRDQIARTRIEESFLNHTSTVLEGVFYFPLPQDASISGFAMWVGGEKVEGDIVEKQRAREIYEQILREKRDPGLLEWTGGNLFKARVYPISREKRIEITYTQALPKVGDTWRYRYALESDLTRLTPLKRLELQVKVSSEAALQSVECPSHPCRVDFTEHAASVEYSAEEVTPTRDFEMVVRADAGAPAVAIPHRRDEDGYFMVLLDAPQPEQPAERELVGEGEPLDLLILADTSGSMVGAPREAQLNFLEALLGSLGPGDRFNLLTCDTVVRPAFGAPVPATADTREEALRFVEARHPLGWSHLEAAFREGFERLRESTHLVYVGDGTVTQGDVDPTAFGQRLRTLFPGRGTVHSVAPGSTFEPGVMQALAELGSGSTRSLGGGTDPARAAADLLLQITRPGVEDLKVEFHGLDVAAVYPRRIPNLAAGTQQVLVGRFDPDNPGDGATLKVRGRQAGEPFELDLPLDLSAAHRGNSFIPRLWARHHLDHLLSQGRSPELERQIVTLSEDFQIITPYTSFLVLESDADRERFQVEKRFRIRDGEEFFAEGRDRAEHELVRKAMLAAKGWRRDLRRELLRWLDDFGRSYTEQLAAQSPDVWFETNLSSLRSLGYVQQRGAESRYNTPSDSIRFGNKKDFLGGDDSGELDLDWATSMNDMPGSEEALELAEKEEFAWDELRNEEQLSRQNGLAKRSTASPASRPVSRFRLDGRFVGGRGGGGGGFYESRLQQDKRVRGGSSFDSLFPQVPGPPTATPDPEWAKDVLDLLRATERHAWLAGLSGGLEVLVESDVKDSRGNVNFTTQHRALLSQGRWFLDNLSGRSQDVISLWCDGEQVGALSGAFRLGRVRPAKEADARPAETSVPGFGDALSGYAHLTPSLERREDGVAVLTFTHPQDPRAQWKVEIDPARKVVISVTTLRDGEQTGRTEHADFEEIDGAWFARVRRHRNAKDEVIGEVRLSYQRLDGGAFGERLRAALAVRAEAVLLGPAPDSLVAAKQALQDGVGTQEDRWMVLGHFAASQQWDRVAAPLGEFLAAKAGKIGAVRIGLESLSQQRRREEARQFALVIATQLADSPRSADDHAAAVLHQVGSFFSALERAELLQSLRPVWARQPYRNPLRDFDRRFLAEQFAAGRNNIALAELRRQTEIYPEDMALHVQYAQQLSSGGDSDLGLAHLTRIEAEDGPWQDSELQSLRAATLDILLRAYRLEDAVTHVEVWRQADEKQLAAQHYDRYLSALFFLGRDAQAERTLLDWLEAGCAEKPSDADLARLDAAMGHALGQGWNLYRQRFYEPFAAPLSRVARRFLEDDYHFHRSNRIAYDWRYRSTDAGIDLQRAWFAWLAEDLDGLEARTVQRLMNILRGLSFAPEAGPEAWEGVLDRTYARWQSATEPAERTLLQQTLEQHGGLDRQIAVARELWRNPRNDAERRLARANLFQRLQQKPWSEEVEAELLVLLPEMEAASAGLEEGPQREADLRARILAAHRMLGWLPEARASARVEATEGVNLLSRRDRKELDSRERKEARRHTLALVRRLEGTLKPAAVLPWLALERIYLEARLGENREALASAARGLLDASLDSEDTEAAAVVRHALAARRSAATLTALSGFGICSEEDNEALLTWLDREIEQSGEPGAPEEGTEGEEKPDTVRDQFEPRNWKFRVLVALDRGAELLAALRQWYGTGERFAAILYGRDLAHVLAELGSLEEAVGVLRKVEEFDELYTPDYRALATWSKALDDRAGERAAIVRSFEVQDEWTIRNWVNQHSNRWQNAQEVPDELDPEVPLALLALLRKAESPENHVWLLRTLYASSRDFRLLQCSADAVMGQTKQQIFSFLRGFRQVTGLLQDEATMDLLRDHVELLRNMHDSVPPFADRRALWLLEFTALHPALAQRHGTRSFEEDALKALRSAFAGDFEDGEPILWARFLRETGVAAAPAVTREMLDQLRTLYRAATRGDPERLGIAEALAELLWQADQAEEALVVLGAALDEVREENEGRIPQAHRNLLGMLSGYLQHKKRFREAEKLWQREIGNRHPTLYRLELTLSLHQVQLAALTSGGEVSLGRGAELYRALLATLRAELRQRTHEMHALSLVQNAGEACSAAHNVLKVKGVARDLSDFAFVELPAVLRLYQYRRGQDMVRNIAQYLYQIAGPRQALEFYVTRAENEPRWLGFGNQDFWARHCNSLGDYRNQVPNLGRPLENRTLAIITRELRADLESRQRRNGTSYDQRYHYFWLARRGDFAGVAEEVIAARGDEATALHAADYLFHGIAEFNAAIDCLLALHGRGELSVEGRHALCTYLQLRGRYEESRPILIGMISARAEVLEYRRMLMRACFHTGRGEELEKVRAAADAHFHEGQRWTESVMAALGEVCLETHLYEHCATYCEEAIAVRRRDRAGHTVPDATLAGYYRNLAGAFSGLGNTAKAVDAAAGAVICWGHSTNERARDLARLVDVLAESEDLEGYVSSLDAEVETSGLENPILRKAIGQAWTQRRDHARAAAQFALALEVEPNDLETHRLRVEALDRAGRGEAATQSLLASAEAASMDLTLFADLGERLTRAGDSAEAERAFTNLVEKKPNEAESHRSLAEIRERSARFDAAAHHWREVIRIRTNEPQAYLRLAKALVKLEQPDEAREVARQILARPWPERFGNVHEEAEKILTGL